MRATHPDLAANICRLVAEVPFGRLDPGGPGRPNPRPGKLRHVDHSEGEPRSASGKLSPGIPNARNPGATPLSGQEPSWAKTPKAFSRAD